MERRKTQMAADFMIVISVALIIFLAIFAAADKRNSALLSYEAGLYARQEADKLASGVNSIFLAGPGTNSTLFFPAGLKDGTQYNLSLMPSRHIVNVKYNSDGLARQYQSTILTSDITGALLNISGNIKLINSNGVIIIAKQQ